jgi:hypothetical protein
MYNAPFKHNAMILNTVALEEIRFMEMLILQQIVFQHAHLYPLETYTIYA